MTQSNIKARLVTLSACCQSGAGTYSGLLGADYSTTSLHGGLGHHVTIEPIIFGNEIALVQHASALCLGRIGPGGGVYLKCDAMCDTEVHSKKKGSLHCQKVHFSFN